MPKNKTPLEITLAAFLRLRLDGWICHRKRPDWIEIYTIIIELDPFCTIGYTRF